MVAIIDYGVGNLGSIYNMLKRVGVTAKIVTERKDLQEADHIILPGVGKYDTGVVGLKERGFDEELLEKAASGIPILGICLGMQLLTESSEEGEMTGLGLIKGRAIRFSDDKGLKIPHMGWNEVTETERIQIMSGVPAPFKFYFAHSYYVKTERKEDTFLKCSYGVDFAAGIQRDNIYGVQFHPEKSHKFGMNLLKNFAEVK